MASLVLDALALDAELESILLTRAQHVCSHLGGRVSGAVQPELTALLRGALWCLSTSSSTAAGDATAGQALLGLRQAELPAGCAETGAALELRPTSRGTALALAGASAATASSGSSSARRASILYGVLMVLVPWAWARLSQLATDPERPELLRWARWMRRAEGAASLASLLVALRFLHSGRSPTLPMALVGLQLACALPQSPRRPIFDFMEQQLVWRTLADLALAVRAVAHSSGRALLPPSVSRQRGARESSLAGGATELAVRLGRSVGLLSPPPPSAPADQAAADEDDEKAEAADGPARGCVFCGESPPHTPQLTPCGHACCYFCVATARMARARCPRCDGALHGAPLAYARASH